MLEIENFQHLEELIEEHELIIIIFTAAWCQPCKRIMPTLEKYDKKMDHLEFLKVDINKCEEISDAYKIAMVPTFVLLQNGFVVEKVTNSSIEKLSAAIINKFKL